MNIRTLTCSIVLAVLLCVISESGAATIGNYRTDIAESKLEQPVARQAPEESSNEDSDEDDEEDDAEQSQLSAQQQQLQQQAQSQEDSDEDPEDDDEDGDGDDDGVFSFLTRRRRDTESETPSEEAAVPAAEQSEKQPLAATETADATAAVATTAAPSRKSSVLVLIRDALKKVTTEIPTEQVATNALQYFQLFEHFIQQTIEQVIGDDDEEDESATAVTTELETPAVAENADADKDIVPEFASESNANVGEKPETPIAEAEKPVAAPVPVESAVENTI